MRCGDVISIFDYEFGDGSKSDSKYFVVMGHHQNMAVGFLTTSKEKLGRKRSEGCHSDQTDWLPSNFYLKTPGAPFSSGTWVLLCVETQNVTVLQQKLREGKAVRVHTFADHHVRALRNCFERSMDWAPVCATYMCP